MRPSLTQTEMIWIVYLLLRGLHECHLAGLYHGDLKFENIMLTSWNWAYLTDFACYKPTYISDSICFSYYFDTNGTRICNLAPERFIDSAQAALLEDRLTPEMDVFALGCVIAQLFLDRSDESLFNLGEIMSFKDPEARANGTAYNPAARIDRIPQKSVRKLVKRMTRLDPEDRGTIKEHLDSWGRMGFPAYFGEMYDYSKKLMQMDPEEKILSVSSDFERLKLIIQRSEPAVARNLGADSPYREAERLTSSCMTSSAVEDREPRSTRDTESFIFKVHHVPDEDLLTQSQLGTSTFFEENESKRSKPNLPVLERNRADLTPDKYIPGMVNILSIVCACLHNIFSDGIKLEAMQLLTNLAECLDDKSRLQKIVPYLVSLLEDTSATVQASALSTLTETLKLVDTFPPSDAKIFPDYILPALETFCSHKDPLVLCSYAKNLATLATIAKRFESESSKLSESILLSHTDHSDDILGSDHPEDPLSRFFIYAIQQLGELESQGLANSVRIKASVRCLLLEDMERLSRFLGPEQTIDVLIPLMKDFLQSGPTWEVRCRVFDALPTMCNFIGQKATQYCVFPFLMHSLYGPEELIINGALRTLYRTSMYLSKALLFSVVDTVCPLLVHPNYVVRKNVSCLLSKLSESENIHQTDVWTFILPCMKPFLMDPIADCIAQNIFDSSKPPLANSVFTTVLKYCRSLISPESNRCDLRNSMGRAEEAQGLVYQYLSNHGDTHSSDREALELIAPFLANCVAYAPSGSYVPTLLGETPDQYETLCLSPSSEDSSPYLTPVGTVRKKPKRKLSTLVADGSSLYSPFSPDSGSSPHGDHVRELSSSGMESTTGGVYIPSAVLRDWRPRGELLATLGEHSGSVNRLAGSENGHHFVSGSDDCKVLLWSTEDLISSSCTRSRSMHITNSRVTALSHVPGEQNFLVGGEKGKVSLLRGEEGFSSSTFTLSSSIVELTAIDAHSFVACTSDGILHGLDLRERDPVFQLSVDPKHGSARSFVFHPQQKWGVLGTGRGVYSCWDFRLLLEVNSWHHPRFSNKDPQSTAIHRMCLDPSPSQDGSCFLASVGTSDIYRWNIRTCAHDIVFRVKSKTSARDQPTLTKSIAPPSPLEYAQEAGWRAKVRNLPLSKALLAFPYTDYFLAGSADGFIRLWDTQDPKKSRQLCGMQSARATTVDFFKYPEGISLVQESEIEELSRRRIPSGHKDSIMDMLVINSADLDLGSVLLSGSRDGIIKAWY